MANLEYIKLLASQTATDISGWDLRAFNRLTDKRKINQTFFDLKQRIEKGVKKKVVTKKVEGLEKLSKKFNPDKNIRKLEAIQEKSLNKISELSKKIEEFNKIIVESKRKIDSLKNSDSDKFLQTQVNEVVQQGLWENPIVEGEYLFFNTKNNVVVCLENNNAGINCTINMGKYAVAINLKNLQITLLPFEENLIIGDHIHPFVCGGEICWGSAYNTVSKLKSELNLSKLLTLLYTLISVYDDSSNPYEHITEFKHGEKLDFKGYVKSGYDYDEYGDEIWCYDCDTDTCKHCERKDAIHPLIKSKYTVI